MTTAAVSTSGGSIACRRPGAAIAVIILLALASCGTPPPRRELALQSASVPPITLSPDGTRASVKLSVLTYNIEGLGWPARSERTQQLREIGARLATARASGDAPDVVLFQEMFSGPAKRAVLASDYPAIVTGPHRTTRAQGSTRDKLPGISRFKRGEFGVHLTGGGLALASRYPIAQVEVRAYGRKSCAGLDCLANKGIMLARITIPGVPTPIDIYNTHMNSRGASRAPRRRNLAAHNRQGLEASEFIDRTHDDAFPLVFGGDFNMRRSRARWSNFTRYQSLSLVHRVCAVPASHCDVQMSWDGDAPWMDTQDLQFFAGGALVAIRPVRVEAMFDGRPDSPKLSDHDGFKVTYEISWPVAARAARVDGAPPS